MDRIDFDQNTQVIITIKSILGHLIQSNITSNLEKFKTILVMVNIEDALASVRVNG